MKEEILKKAKESKEYALWFLDTFKDIGKKDTIQEIREEIKNIYRKELSIEIT